MTPPSERQLPERVARNQSSFREYNERIEPHNAGHHWVDPPYADWICECALEACSAPVQMTMAEYESVRAEPTRFLVAPSEEHLIPEVERIVEQTERYWVVEKLGDAADMSEALDDRAGEAASRRDEFADADQVAWNLPVPSR